MTVKESADLLVIPNIDLVKNAKNRMELPMNNEDWINAFKWYNKYYFKNLQLFCRPCYDKVLDALLKVKNR